MHVVHKGETQAEIDGGVKNATEMLKGLSQELVNGGLKATTKIVVGSPVEELRKVANAEDVSLISMSSVGKDTLKTGRI